MNEKQLVLASSISLSKIILFEKLYQEAFDTVSSGEETLRLPCFIQRNNQRQIETSNASVNSGCAQRPPPPPRADPRALAFFFFTPWMGNSREWGLLSCQIPRGRDEKRGQIPRPPSKLQHFSLITQSSSCYFNERFFVSIKVFLRNSAILTKTSRRDNTSLWFQHCYKIIDITEQFYKYERMFFK